MQELIRFLDSVPVMLDSAFREMGNWLSNYITAGQLGIIIFILTIITGCLGGFGLYKLIQSGVVSLAAQRALNNTSNAMVKQLKDTKVDYFNWDSIQSYMNRMGITHMLGDKGTPIYYMLIKCGIAVFGCAIGIQIAWYWGFVGLVVGFMCFDWFAIINNDSDNNAMLDDIKTIYDNMKIQARAGVYITTAVAECSSIIKNKRLRDAMMELANDSIANGSLDKATQTFAGKFKNQYIESLALIIQQANESGHAADMFEAMADSIDEIQSAIFIKEQQKIKTQIMTAQMMIYGSLIGTIIFVFLGMMGDNLQMI